MTRTLAAFAAAVAMSALGAAAAQAEPQTVSLSTAGYDLNTQAGAKAFYRHLSQEVTAACGAPSNFFASREEGFQACYHDTMKSAVEQTRAPLVAALAGQAQVQVASR
jgi:UrcA family protein